VNFEQVIENNFLLV